MFPNDAAVIRLVGAVLADMHEEWQSGDGRYLAEGFMALLKPNGDPNAGSSDKPLPGPATTKPRRVLPAAS
jgi:hypothetical protein